MDKLESEVYHTVVSMEGHLWKKGKSLHFLSKRYFLLSGGWACWGFIDYL